jgi:hypothetical protein
VPIELWLRLPADVWDRITAEALRMQRARERWQMLMPAPFTRAWEMLERTLFHDAELTYSRRLYLLNVPPAGPILTLMRLAAFSQMIPLGLSQETVVRGPDGVERQRRPLVQIGRTRVYERQNSEPYSVSWWWYQEGS